MAQRIEKVRVHRAGTPEAASVQLVVPAHKDFIVIVRSAVAQLGTCFGFTPGQIADVRLAVDEACNLLVAENPSDAPVSALECRADGRGDVLLVTIGARNAAVGWPDTGSFGWTVLAALVDALAFEQDKHAARAERAKRR